MREVAIKRMGSVINEIVERLGPGVEGAKQKYCIMRRMKDNDLLILGPYDTFNEAALTARDTDTVKPMFREEDLGN